MSSTPQPSNASPKKQRKRWNEVFTKEMYDEYVTEKFNEFAAQMAAIAVGGEAEWRTAERKKLMAKERTAKAAERKAIRDSQVEDKSATCDKYAERLEKEFKKCDFEVLDGAILSGFDIPTTVGYVSADKLADDAIPKELEHSTTLVLFDHAVALGFKPKGIVSHSNRYNAKPGEGEAKHEYKVDLGDDEEHRCYVGSVLAIRGITKEMTQPFSFSSKDRVMVQKEAVVEAEKDEEPEPEPEEEPEPEPEEEPEPEPEPAPKRSKTKAKAKVAAKPRRKATKA